MGLPTAEMGLQSYGPKPSLLPLNKHRYPLAWQVSLPKVTGDQLGLETEEVLAPWHGFQTAAHITSCHSLCWGRGCEGARTPSKSS